MIGFVGVAIEQDRTRTSKNSDMQIVKVFIGGKDHLLEMVQNPSRTQIITYWGCVSSQDFSKATANLIADDSFSLLLFQFLGTS